MSTLKETLSMLDGVLGPRTVEELAQEHEDQFQSRMASMGVLMTGTMGVGMETQQCPVCKGTMVRNYETDENGNRINEGPFICNNCGNVA